MYIFANKYYDLLTKINKNRADDIVVIHKEVIDLLQTRLPKRYVAEAKKRLLETKGIDVSSSMIRQIKNGYTVNWEVLEILTEMANQNQKAVLAIGELISNK